MTFSQTAICGAPLDAAQTAVAWEARRRGRDGVGGQDAAAVKDTFPFQPARLRLDFLNNLGNLHGSKSVIELMQLLKATLLLASIAVLPLAKAQTELGTFDSRGMKIRYAIFQG